MRCTWWSRGRYRCDAAGGEEVRRFGPKDVFGEVALLNEDGRRTADAIAATDCVLLAITRDAFTAIAGPSIKAALHGRHRERPALRASGR